MTLESLLLSRDVELVRVLRPTLEKLSIDVEICQEARAATDILISEKFDAVIVDCDDLKGGREVLQGVRSTPSNRNSVTFAVLNGKQTTTQQAFEMGANFVLQKPISQINAARCFHAALNFMLKERRRYFRQPVRMPVQVVLDDKEVQATSTNISEGGIALQLREALAKDARPHLKFTLPETRISMSLEAVIAWADIKGRAGFRFQNVPESSQQVIERWLNERMEKDNLGTLEHGPTAEPESIQ